MSTSLRNRLVSLSFFCCFFFFNDTATTEIYTLSLHDAFPIWSAVDLAKEDVHERHDHARADRSEEHTSELQSRLHLVCRLLLEKKQKTQSDSDRTGIPCRRDGGTVRPRRS